MESRVRRYGLWIMIGLTAIGWGGLARAESFSRISDLHGSLNLKEGDEAEEIDATLNLLLREGDRLETGYAATAEVEMPGLARVRMGNSTEIRIERYGGPDSRDEVVLERGGVYVDDRDGSTVIKTPSSAVSPNAGSSVRVDLDRDEARVRVAVGSAQIQTLEDGRYATRPLLLRSGEELVLDTGVEPVGPRPYSAVNDDLDRYQREREKEPERTAEYENGEKKLDRPLMGSEELNRSGEWVTVDGAWVWRPYVSVGWRPYSIGYWAWYGSIGWTWISDEPFGYVTFHYGAWIYDPFYGWCWVPGYVWRPAYVTWIAVGPYYAWAPLNPFGQVVIISNIVVVNRIDHWVFTVAPKRVFVVDPKSSPPAGRRFIPPAMRVDGSIRAAGGRLFKENPKVERIKDFNAVRPDRGRKSETTVSTAQEQRHDRTYFPQPGRPLTREAGSFKRGDESLSPAPGIVRESAPTRKWVERTTNRENERGAPKREGRIVVPQERIAEGRPPVKSDRVVPGMGRASDPRHRAQADPQERRTGYPIMPRAFSSGRP